MSLVDTHVHIDFYDNIEYIVEQYESKSIFTFFVTYLPQVFQKHLKKHSSYNYIRLCLGYHPSMVNAYDFNKKLFLECLDYTDYVGEVGLENTKSCLNFDRQKEIFDFIASTCKNDKILSIHSKKAEKEVFQILCKNEVKHAIFHWYTGGAKLIDDIASAGYFFSVNPNMLRTKSGKKTLERIPLENILFETDGPFTKIQNNASHPNLIQIAYNSFNEFYGISDFEHIVFENFKRLLRQRKNYDSSC